MKNFAPLSAKLCEQTFLGFLGSQSEFFHGDFEEVEVEVQQVDFSIVFVKDGGGEESYGKGQLMSFRIFRPQV